jgi:hypothetical protein
VVLAYIGENDHDPEPFDDDAPESLEWDDEFDNDEYTVKLLYHCAVTFHWTFDETLAQDEGYLNDVLKFERQIGYQRWANRHKVQSGRGNDFDEIPALSPQSLFGMITKAHE